MAVIYRYTDRNDDIIKYVGIVYGVTRTLEQRIKEHEKDAWYPSGDWKIEYISEKIDSRSEAEAFESHYISLFGTDRYFNTSKAGWGINKFLPDRTADFIEYRLDGTKPCEAFSEEIPFWERYTLSIEEAAAYFRIGENKLREIAKDESRANLILWNGNRPQIKRRLFEEYIDSIHKI